MSEPGPPTNDQVVRCWQCGYDLSGVGIGQSIATCPECGASFDPARPSPIAAWPPVWKTGLYLSGAMLLAVGLETAAWLLGRWGFAEAESMLGGFTRMFELDFALAVAPALVAWHLARTHAHPAERWMIGMGLFVAGVAGNLVILMAAALVRVMLR